MTSPRSNPVCPASPATESVEPSALTQPMRAMLFLAEPDRRDASSSYGVELNTGADYAVAKALKRRGLGSYEQGQWGMPGLWFSNAEGLQVAADLSRGGN